MYTAEYHEDCINDLEHLGPVTADRVLKSVEERILRNPIGAGLSLSGGLPNGRFVPVASTHVIFTVDTANKTVKILGIRPEGVGSLK